MSYWIALAVVTLYPWQVADIGLREQSLRETGEQQESMDVTIPVKLDESYPMCCGIDPPPPPPGR